MGKRFRWRQGLGMAALVSTAPLGVTVAQGAPSGDAVGGVARVVILHPRLGLDSAFEAGYRRHLEWHRRQNDPWTWLAWSFMTGSRAGWTMDGTFGHPWSHLDQAVAPGQDGADFEVNVSPYADLVEHVVYELDGSLSREAASVLEARLLSVATVRLRPGGRREFEAGLQAAGRAIGAGGGPGGWVVLRLISGGPPDRYLIMLPGRGLADLATVAEWTNRMSSLPVISEWQVETLVLRPDMSYHPGSSR